MKQIHKDNQVPNLNALIASVVVDRYPSGTHWTLSDFLILSEKKAVGVEDERRETKKHGETCISNGIYPLGLRDSPKFSSSYYVDENGFLSRTKTERFNKPHQLIWIKDVPNFEYILIHWGNTDLDSHGCYIIGAFFADFVVTNPHTKLKETRKGVAASRDRYVQIYPIIWKMIKDAEAKGETIYIQYRDKK